MDSFSSEVAVDLVTKYCVCPASGGDLRGIEIQGLLWGYWSAEARRVYPIIDGIAVLLPDTIRSYTLEYDKVRAAADAVTELGEDDELASAFLQTLEVLASRRGMTSWEWEDEEYWTQNYEAHRDGAIEVNWNDRLWQREFLFERLMSEMGSLRERVVVEMGSGEGQDFRSQIAPRAEPTTLYIATDISLAALKLNRERNPHRHALYLLASGGYLPLRPASVDVLCCFGILHHTEHKANTLSRCASVLKPNAYALISEAIERPLLGPYLPRFIRGDKESSAHEERIPEHELLGELAPGGNFEVLEIRRHHTIFYSAVSRFVPGLRKRYRWAYRGVVAIDRFLMRCLGGWLPHFRAATLDAIVRRVP